MNELSAVCRIFGSIFKLNSQKYITIECLFYANSSKSVYKLNKRKEHLMKATVTDQLSVLAIQ